MKKNFLVMLALLVSLSFSASALQNELEYLTALLTKLEKLLSQESERPLPPLPFIPPTPEQQPPVKPGLAKTEPGTRPVLKRTQSEYYGRKPLAETTTSIPAVKKEEERKEAESPIEAMKRRALERQAREEKRKSMFIGQQPVPGAEKEKEREVSRYKPSLQRVQSQKFERPILVPEVSTKKVTFVGLGNEVEQLKSLPNTTRKKN